MQTIAGTDGHVDTRDLLLSAKLAKIDLPEEFLLKSPYAKKYAAGSFDASDSPRAVKWRPFYEAIEYPKMQATEEWSKKYAEREARKAAAKAAAEQAAAEKAAAEAAAKALQVAQPKVHREYVSDYELRRAHAVIKSRLSTMFGDLRASFRAVDKDGSGFVSHEEAHAALATLNLGLPTRIMQRFTDIADYDGDGEISFAEFARVLTADDIMEMKDSVAASYKGNMVNSRDVSPSIQRTSRVIKNGVTEDALRTAIMLIKEKLLQKYNRLDTAFKQIDEDRSGYLTRAEFRFFIKNLCNMENMSANLIEVLCDLMDADGDGQMNHQEFV